MQLHDPFIITPRLLPGLKVGISYISLEKLEKRGPRALAHMRIDGEINYLDASLQSGAGGFESIPEVFETFLGFLEAAIESYKFEERHPGLEGENSDLFPRAVVEWAVSHRSEIESLRTEICDEDGYVHHHLIESET